MENAMSSICHDADSLFRAGPAFTPGSPDTLKRRFNRGVICA